MISKAADVLLTAALVAVFCFGSAQAQSVIQGGPTIPGHAPMYQLGPGQGFAAVQDSGFASGLAATGVPQGAGLSELLQINHSPGTGPFGTHISAYDNPVNSPTGYHFLSFDSNAQSGGLLAYGAGGSASPLPFNCLINGQFIPNCLQQTATITGLVTVPNNAALLTAAITPTIYRAGFYNPGDGGGAFYNFSSTPCSINTPNGDNGSQVKVGAGGCWNASFAAPPLVQVWGAKCDGVLNTAGGTDDFNALQAAFNWGIVSGIPGTICNKSATLTINPSTISYSAGGHGPLGGFALSAGYMGIQDTYAAGDSIWVNPSGGANTGILYNLTLEGLSLSSTIIKTSGFGFHFRNVRNSRGLKRLMAGQIEVGSKLFGGFWFDASGGDTLSQFSAQVQGSDGVAISGNTISPNADIYLDQGTISLSPTGIHIGGGIGGIQITNVDVVTSTVQNFLWDEAIVPAANLQLFIASSFFDSSLGKNMVFNDPGAGQHIFLTSMSSAVSADQNVDIIKCVCTFHISNSLFGNGGIIYTGGSNPNKDNIRLENGWGGSFYMSGSQLVGATGYGVNNLGNMTIPVIGTDVVATSNTLGGWSNIDPIQILAGLGQLGQPAIIAVPTGLPASGPPPGPPVIGPGTGVDNGMFLVGQLQAFAHPVHGTQAAVLDGGAGTNSWPILKGGIGFGVIDVQPGTGGADNLHLNSPAIQLPGVPTATPSTSALCSKGGVSIEISSSGTCP